jgi:hypothetical protein
MCLTDYSSAVLNDSLVLGGWSPFNVSARHGRVPVTSHLAAAQSRITDSRRVDHGNKLLLLTGGSADVLAPPHAVPSIAYQRR